MKIGIDAKWFFKDDNPSGKVTTRNIVEYLVEISAPHQLYIFLRSEDRHKKFPYTANNVHLIYLWSGINMLSNVFVLPFAAYKYKLDSVLFQSFVSFLFRKRKVAFIYDCIYLTNPEYFSWKERVYSFPLKYLARGADAVVTISDSERQRITRMMQISEEKIFVAHCSISDDYKQKEAIPESIRNTVLEKYGLPKEYLLYVGRLNRRKNLANLLKAFSLLSNKNIHLLLVGSSEGKASDIHHIITSLDLADRVMILGYVPDDELRVLYSLAKVFCYVSFDEGFGMPPLESMACGVPAVVSNTGSLPEVCADAGMYADPHDPEDIADKIDSLLVDSHLYGIMKERALKNVLRFSWNRSAEIILETLLTP